MAGARSTLWHRSPRRAASGTRCYLAYHQVSRRLRRGHPRDHRIHGALINGSVRGEAGSRPTTDGRPHKGKIRFEDDTPHWMRRKSRNGGMEKMFPLSPGDDDGRGRGHVTMQRKIIDTARHGEEVDQSTS